MYERKFLASKKVFMGNNLFGSGNVGVLPANSNSSLLAGNFFMRAKPIAFGSVPPCTDSVSLCGNVENAENVQDLENKNVNIKSGEHKKAFTLPLAEDLTIAGMVSMSTVDWPDKISCVLFLQGCPWKCVYCHNYDILDPKAEGKISFNEVLSLLEKRKNLLDGVVFSGGEATRQQSLLPAIKKVKNMGFDVGLHTAGAYPKKLELLLKYVDWVGLDIKALPETYDVVVQRPNAGTKAYDSLKLVLDSGVDYEVRLTIFPDLLNVCPPIRVAKKCLELGVKTFALQQARQLGSPDGFVADVVGWDQQFNDIAKEIEKLGFEKFIVRHA